MQLYLKQGRLLRRLLELRISKGAVRGQSKTDINSFSWRLRTNPCRNRSSSFSVGLPRSVCAVVNIVSVVMIKALANNIIMKYIEAI